MNSEEKVPFEYFFKGIPAKDYQNKQAFQSVGLFFCLDFCPNRVKNSVEHSFFN